MGRFAREAVRIRRSGAPRWFALGAFVVFAAAWGGLALTRGSERIATIWIANALLLVLLLRTPRRQWPALVAGGVMGSGAANLASGYGVWLAGALSLCNVFEVALVALPLRRRFGRTLDLSRLSHLGAFGLLAGIVAPAASGLLAAGALAYAFALPPLSIWAVWYPADALGLLVVTPLALMLRVADLRRLAAPDKRWRTLAWFTALAGVTAIVFGQSTFPLLFLPMAVLGLVAASLGPAATALGIGCVAIGATAATVMGHGPMTLVPGGLATRVLLLQGFLAAIVLSKLPLTALLSTRARLEAEVSEANARLRLAEKVAGVGHWRVEVASGKLTWSEGVFQVYGLDPRTAEPSLEAAIGAYHPDDRETVARSVETAVATASDFAFVLRLVRPDGAVREVLSRGLCETGPDGRVSAIFGIIMDMTETRQAERSVQESEARYRMLADNTTDMISHMDLSGRRLFVSPGSRELLGYGPDELIGTSPKDMSHPDDVAGLRRVLADLSTGVVDRAVTDYRLRHRDGRWIWIEASMRLLRGADGRPAGLVAATRNIMDRRRADEALRESEARYRLLADHSGDLIALKPTFAGARSYVSPSSLSVVGYEPEDFAALPPAGLVHPDDLARVEAEFASLSAANPEISSVHRVRHKAGHTIWVDVTFRLTDPGGPDQATIVRARDVTARHHAEQALAASEARYRLLADHTSDLIVLGHSDGRRSYVSPAVEAMLGYTVEEAHGVRMRDWVHPDDIETVFAETAGLSDADPSACVTFRLRHKAGHYIWAEAAFRRVEDGAEATVVSTMRDVTERVAQAEQLEAAKAAAESGARIKAEFLANMSHELRTPLAGMLGVHDLIQSDPTLSARQRHFVELAQESGRALLTIVNDILDFSKIEAGQMTIERVPFSLREVVEACRRLGSEAIKLPSVSLTAEIDAGVPDLLMGDPTRVRQVLLNLVTNAVKFTTEGTVTIRAAWRDGTLRLAVTDTGIGIAQEAIPQLFERFNQADGSTARRFGGTGLGLSISKRLAELMGGAIGVDSEPGRGSTFRVTLPIESGEPERRRKPRTDALSDRAMRSRRILVAEDNAINREIILTVLSQKGHRVVLAEDGVTALDAFRREPCDIVLMDVQMPNLDGLAATAEIRALERRESRPPTPVVALTANAMAEEAARCRAAGMDAHVAKPIEWPTLFATIERLCNASAGRPSIEDDAVPTPTILDEETLEDLAALLGRERIGTLLEAFRKDLELRLGALGSAQATVEDLVAHAHAVTALAGQLGFMELSALCADLQEDGLSGGGLDRLGSLRGAADRALKAAADSPYAEAA